MGCCASQEEVSQDAVQEIAPELPDQVGGVSNDPNGATAADIIIDLQQAEAKAVDLTPEQQTFLATVIEARQRLFEDPTVMRDCCVRLQAHNRKIKNYIATADAQAVDEAMNGGFMGWGTNDRKLITALCSRTKQQLQLTKKRYRALYDKDLRTDVRSETGGNYGKMMYYALSSRAEYIADMIDLACKGWGWNEMTLMVELFVICKQERLQEGKAVWEGRNDKNLIDYIKSELGSSYKEVCALFLLLLKGERDQSDATDEEKANEQIDALNAECTKGIFSSANAEEISNIIGGNGTAQNMLVAKLYENKFEVSLAKALKGKCGDKYYMALSALLMPKPDFIAMRLEAAMKGWGTDKSILLRLLGGLQGSAMVGVREAYERKYGLPLDAAFRKEIEGNFGLACQTWIRALDDPSRGCEDWTEQDVESIEVRAARWERQRERSQCVGARGGAERRW